MTDHPKDGNTKRRSFVPQLIEELGYRKANLDQKREQWRQAAKALDEPGIISLVSERPGGVVVKVISSEIGATIPIIHAPVAFSSLAEAETAAFGIALQANIDLFGAD